MEDSINALCPYNIDRHLMAAVQINAGAHCHESANLLYCYQLLAQVYQNALDCKDDDEAQQALKTLHDSEINLRKFLFRCLRSD